MSKRSGIPTLKPIPKFWDAHLVPILAQNRLSMITGRFLRQNRP
ncbi:hypothetical protein [Candidatus Phycosocius spiralis]|nr:hypothetical protein [Candidatus Phycosocius spiralis]